MDQGDYRIDERASAEELSDLENRLYAYNVDRSGVPFGGFLSWVLRNGEGAVVGGIQGWAWGQVAHLDQLWVDPGLRGTGQGTTLLLRFEEAAKARGCQFIAAETFSFQALPFYQRAGYEVVAQIDGYPAAPHSHHVLRKGLK